MAYKIKDLNNQESDANLKSLNRDRKDHRSAGQSKEEELNRHFKESDIERFKDAVKIVYRNSVEGYKGLVQKYRTGFKAPILYFDFDDSYKTASGFIDDSRLSFKVLGAYDFISNRIIIKPGLLYKYVNHGCKTYSIEHTVNHEIAHSLVKQLGLADESMEEGKTDFHGIVKGELLANLFAAELEVAKQGLPISNESMARQLIKDDSDLEYLSKDIDAAKAYFRWLNKYSREAQNAIEHISYEVYKYIKKSEGSGKVIDYDAVNDYYSEKVDKVLKNYLVNIMRNYAISVYSAPVLGAAKALLSERKGVEEIINSVSKDMSSVKEIRRYLKGSFASVDLRSMSITKPGSIKRIPIKLVTESLKNEGIYFDYKSTFSRIADSVEDEFDEIGHYLSKNLRTERKLLRDLSRMEKRFGINSIW
ncbi:hypothetical protein Mia14_0539 [Candidatus Mancarchaeum acidiphilum]|uniref:Uncharacterized protein n=1 Tax=Candidatus Mancarchaeum acidiphilum TaxID=1920749 RepID=A0A218NN19_9ARCH|nr:hypothetical protein [Candidatus Mancarchaeum acidiphilum]ASI13852.1 hypothetical protein Mia14_0539 [Candidatus Mancarchaeum acidiphilum]